MPYRKPQKITLQKFARIRIPGPFPDKGRVLDSYRKPAVGSGISDPLSENAGPGQLSDGVGGEYPSDRKDTGMLPLGG